MKGMNAKVAALQTVLGVTVDGIWGVESQAALDRTLGEFSPFSNSNDANSYLKRYNKFRGQGMSHDHANAAARENK